MISVADLRRRIGRANVPEGSGFDWEWATSLPYRCLADVGRAMVMPAAPDEQPVYSAQTFNQQLAYYTCLQSYLTYSFGWTRHDKGLEWWRKQKFVPLDDRLALIRAMWHEDGTLVGFFAWTTTVDPELAIAPLKRWARSPDLGTLHLDSPTRQLVGAALQSPPWSGGRDPLHLGGGFHGGLPSGPPLHEWSDPAGAPRMKLMDVDVDSRRALFVSDGVDGWYAGLCEAGSELPELPQQRNWKVDVYVWEIGFAGTYRQSRQTGLWFAGRHAIHMAGN